MGSSGLPYFQFFTLINLKKPMMFGLVFALSLPSLDGRGDF
jgi:hypothetical protein